MQQNTQQLTMNIEKLNQERKTLEEKRQSLISNSVQQPHDAGTSKREETNSRSEGSMREKIGNAFILSSIIVAAFIGGFTLKKFL